MGILTFNVPFFMLPFAQCCLIFHAHFKCVSTYIIYTAKHLTLEARTNNNNKWKIKIEIKKKGKSIQAHDGVAVNGEWTDSIVFIIQFFSGMSAWLAYAWKMLLMASIPLRSIVFSHVCASAMHRHDTVLQCQHGEWCVCVYTIYIHPFRGSVA